MWYDLVIVLILGLAVFRGAIKGFVWQLASIAGLVLSFIFAESFSLAVAPYIDVEPPLNRWIAMFVLYILFSFASFAVARLLRGWIEKVKLVEYDRHLGSLFGFVKGAIFCLVLTFFAVTLSEKARAHVLASKSGYFAAVIMDRLHPVMPDELRKVLEPYIHQLDRDDLDLRNADHAADDDGEGDGQADNDGPGRGESSAGDRKGGSESPLAGWMAKLPTVVDEELRQIVFRSLENTVPENREELIEKLSSGIPSAMRAVAADWQDGKPAENDGGRAPEYETLLQEISAVYSSLPDGQAAIAEQIEVAMTGVPDPVVLGVLRDWRADLLAQGPDPDPQTNVATPLDTRIARQLGIASSSIPESPTLR